MGSSRSKSGKTAEIVRNINYLLDKKLETDPNLLKTLAFSDRSPLITGLSSELPRHFTRFDDLIVLNSDTAPCILTDSLWHKLFHSDNDPAFLWHAICTVLNCKRIAVLTKISTDKYRTPVIKLVYSENCCVISDDGAKWVHKKDNGITYHFNIERCMFSKGNINEKMRMARLDCPQETVVDLFAGIGYFTLPLLVHAKAKFVYACEWNLYAVEALRKNLRENRVAEGRYEILYGDNRQCAPRGVADRVILGLLPTSEGSWCTALRALKPNSGGVLHVHACVDLKNKSNEHNFDLPEDTYKNYANFCIGKLETSTNELNSEQSEKRNWKFLVDKIVRVKSYGPLVDHVVIDVRVKSDG